MQTFETPEPITVALELGVGDVTITASDRRDTVVDVRPSDATKTADLGAARETSVDFANGHLAIKSQRGWRQWKPWGNHGSVDIRLELPSDSALRGTTGVATVRGTGRLGPCRFTSGAGALVLEETGPLEVRTGAGDVSVEVVLGRADVKTTGTVRLARVDGRAVIRNGNGDIWIGEVTGEVRATAANGAITVDHAREGIVAKTANGSVRIDEVASGHVVAESAFGRVEVGVAEGVAAWLDLQTKFGRVMNDLEETERPEPGADAVEIRAHTSMGDVAIRRAATSGARGERA